MSKLQIKLKVLDPECYPYATEVGDWIDLRSATDMTIEPGSYASIPLGICMELPDGYEAHILPRSSLFRNYHLICTNSMGIVDNSFCGPTDEWRFLVYKPKLDEEVEVEAKSIRKGDRICQFRIVPVQPKISFIDSCDIDKNKSRGGFGSTGIS